MWSSNNFQLPGTLDRLERLDKGDGINAIHMAHMAYTMHLSTVGLYIIMWSRVRRHCFDQTY